jgi:hypothetical protein
MYVIDFTDFTSILLFSQEKGQSNMESKIQSIPTIFEAPCIEAQLFAIAR